MSSVTPRRETSLDVQVGEALRRHRHPPPDEPLLPAICPGTHVVFIGPSWGAGPATVPGTTFRGPVARGDLAEAARLRPCSIAVVDGYFDGRFSVGHREISDVLRQGIRVFGSSSMGALRAVEMATVGMIGHGWVYRRFQAGGPDVPDDEVALVHDPEPPYRVLSDPVVNIAFGLEILRGVGAMSRDVATRLLDAQCARFYPRRSFLAVAEDYRRLTDAAEDDDVMRILRDGRALFDVKHHDAVALVRLLAGHGQNAATRTRTGSGTEHQRRG